MPHNSLSQLFSGIGMSLLTTDHDREISLLGYAPIPRIEGSCE
jgi:hypothetical protein